MRKALDFVRKYHHGLYIVAYMIVYLIFFYIIEHVNIPADAYTILHTSMDDRIPFVVGFILPYDSWFLFVGLYVCLFVFFDKEEYTKLFTTLTVGMTLFIILSAIWPNAHDLRPMERVAEGKGMCYAIIRKLYATDTCTNLVPSIHVYNSLMIMYAVLRSKKIGRNLGIKLITCVWGLSIVLSTMFVKQHSIIDVTAAVVLGIVMGVATYGFGFNFFTLFRKNKQETKEESV